MWLTLEIRNESRILIGELAGNKKPESKARHMGWRVDGQQKNQPAREMHNAAALCVSFFCRNFQKIDRSYLHCNKKQMF